MRMRPFVRASILCLALGLTTALAVGCRDNPKPPTPTPTPQIQDGDQYPTPRPDQLPTKTAVAAATAAAVGGQACKALPSDVRKGQSVVRKVTSGGKEREYRLHLPGSIDPTKPLRVVLYLRYSSSRQQATSLEQQRDTIKETIARLKHPWVIVDEYSDAKTSGKFVRKRPGFKAMRKAIYSKTLVLPV